MWSGIQFSSYNHVSVRSSRSVSQFLYFTDRNSFSSFLTEPLSKQSSDQPDHWCFVWEKVGSTQWELVWPKFIVLSIGHKCKNCNTLSGTLFLRTENEFKRKKKMSATSLSTGNLSMWSHMLLFPIRSLDLSPHHRHPVQPEPHSAVWWPGCRYEGHPGGQEHEGAVPEGAAPPAAAASAAGGPPESGGQTVCAQQHEPQQRQ